MAPTITKQAWNSYKVDTDEGTYYAKDKREAEDIAAEITNESAEEA